MTIPTRCARLGGWRHSTHIKPVATTVGLAAIAERYRRDKPLIVLLAERHLKKAG